MSFSLQKILGVIVFSVSLIFAEGSLSLPNNKLSMDLKLNSQAPILHLQKNIDDGSLGSTSALSSMKAHSSLAFFSLGSIAVGGLFYAIQQSSQNPRVHTGNGSTKDMNTALGFAGLSALVSGGAFFYFSFHTL